MRCSFFRLRAFLALSILCSSFGASLTPARADSAEPKPLPLGGPSVPSLRPQTIVKANAVNKPPASDTGAAAVINTATTGNPPTTGTPYYPGATYSDATDQSPAAGQSPAPGQPPAALGPAPYDLALIKAIKVGSQLLPQTPLRVGNLDVLIPLVDQMPALGATVTHADLRNVPGALDGPSDAQYFQINLPVGPPIVLTVGKSTAWVGNQEQTLRAAPLVIGDQIYLPVFSIAPLLGAAARLDDSGTLVLTPTIQSVELFPIKDTVAITIKASAPVPDGLAKIVTVKGKPGNSPKVFIDFPGYSMGFDAGNSTIERLVAPGSGNVLRARAGMPSKFPDVTRIVLDLKKPLNGVQQSVPDQTLFAMVLVNKGNVAPPITDQSLNPPAPPLPEVGAPVAYNVPNNLRGMIIVVDAGHGGHDTGARGAVSLEKNHTLDIAQRLRNALQARGANVLMTRDDDTFISLQGRVDFANQRRANLFVSVHINASVNHGSTGTETFYYTAMSQSLAREVHKELAKATGRPSRGISQARFYVIRNTRMPSILTESAFITNSKEEALLCNANYREHIARGIAQGVANYVAIYGRGGISG